MTAAMEMHYRPAVASDLKSDETFLETTGTAIPSTYADMVSSRISKEHQDFLMERHGTLELDPIPSMDPADPYNWPGWKVWPDLPEV